MRHAWPAVLLGVLLAPLVTWLPMLAMSYPTLGLPPYPAAAGIDLWHGQTFFFAAMLLVALVAFARDRWLGAALAAVAAHTWYIGVRVNITHAIIFTMGVLMLLAVREIPSKWDHHIRWLLVALGSFQAVYVIQQHLGYDLLWNVWKGSVPLPVIQPLGTFGSVNGVSAYIAIIAPLMPVWAMALAVLVIWWGHSLGAIAAVIAAVIARVLVLGRVNRRAMASAMVATLVLTLGSAYYLRPATGVLRETNAARLDIWRFAFVNWARATVAPATGLTNPTPELREQFRSQVGEYPPEISNEFRLNWGPILNGWGLGGWAQQVPLRQAMLQHMPTREAWNEAHNEYLEWLMETGLIGFTLLGLWLRTHWRMFLHPRWGPSLCALAVSALTWHPLHIVSSALVGILLVGLATRKEELCDA